MNREIKFRAWDKELEKMTKYFNLESIANTHTLTIGSEHIVMQYTGLKDKNGKDIFEGDIVGGNDIKGGYEVFWNESKCAFDIKGGSGFITSWMLSFSLGIEIIGNIYEHGHLLDNN